MLRIGTHEPCRYGVEYREIDRGVAGSVARMTFRENSGRYESTCRCFGCIKGSVSPATVRGGDGSVSVAVLTAHRAVIQYRSASSPFRS